MSKLSRNGGIHNRFSVNLFNSSMEQNRLQGWLTVANAVEKDHLDQLEWQKRYCVLDKDERKLYFFNDTESVLSSSPLSPVKFNYQDDQDGAVVSRQRKDLSVLDPQYSSFQRNTRQTRSLRDRMRNTISKSVKKSTKSGDTLLPPGSTGGGSVRVSRSRSFGKVDKIDQSLTLALPTVTSKLGHSLENIHRVSSHGVPEGRLLSLGDHSTFLNLSMRGSLSILPVHESISPRHSCFRIITDSDILYASCGSKQELDKWLTNLLNCQRPNKNHLRRLDTQLSIWVLEARNLQPKKSYFCEVSLNGILYAQTCVKIMNDILFWGEPFVFNDLPPLGSITVKIFKENFNKKKRDKQTPATDLGKVEVPALVLEGGQLLEKWYPVTMVPTGKSSSSQSKEKDNVSIRLKLQYQVVSILPLKAYEDFLKYLDTNYSVVCEVLEPVISARAKDDIAQTLVRILQVRGKAKDFLCDVIMAEVHRTENENLIFRGNTFATKAVDTYMKMVGEQYLRDALSPFIHHLLEFEEDCEVDPLRMSPGANLPSNQASLTQLAKKAWLDILSSVPKFPTDLRAALNSIRQRFGVQREDACFKLISGSIFLRFLCPAILSPSLFHLCQEYPDEKTARKLTLVAKVLQNLANFARFGVKEEYMCFMNDFVETEIKNMKEFLNKISTPIPESEPLIPWIGRQIDLGRETSIMHSALTSQLKTVKLSEHQLQQVDTLVGILLQLSKAQEEDIEDPFSSTFEALRVMQSTISTFTADRENSESSSEYNTPAGSQATSPAHEQSPPPVDGGDTARSILGSAAQVLSQSSEGQKTNTSPPSTSPIHSGSISRLVTHSQDRNGVRRVSDTELKPVERKHTRRVSGGGVYGLEAPRSSRGSLKLDDHASMADLRAENAYLRDEVASLRKQLLRQHEDTEKEGERLRKLEEDRRRSEHELKNLRDSRGKILRGLNTQTEIALIQFKRDFEHLRKQLQSKDEIIAVQERRIASLIEATATLRSGLLELNSLPRHEDSDSDEFDEDVRARMAELERSEGLVNGHAMAVSTGPGRESSTFNVELQQVISQLEGGKFD